jgi:hypothetical protein
LKPLRFKAKDVFPTELIYPALLVIFVIEIVLLGTSVKGMTPWTFMLFPVCFALPFGIWLWAITNGSYYLVSKNKLSVYMGFILSEEIFINSIYKID